MYAYNAVHRPDQALRVIKATSEDSGQAFYRHNTQSRRIHECDHSRYTAPQMLRHMLFYHFLIGCNRNTQQRRNEFYHHAMQDIRYL